MGRLRASLCLLLLPAAAAALDLGPAGLLDLRYSGRAQSQALSGNTTRSLLQGGETYTQELDSRWELGLGSGVRLQASWQGLLSNDRLRGPDDGLRTLQAWAQAEGEHGPAAWWLRGGDAYVDLSRLSFAQSFRGAAAGLRWGALSLAPFGGLLWEADAATGRARRLGTGGRLGWNAGPLGLGLNGAWVADDEDKGTSLQDRSQVASIEARWRPARGLQAEAEAALSEHEDRLSGQRLEARNAAWGRLAWVHPSLRAAADYERVDPGFRAPGAAVQSDRERFAGRFDWRAARALGLRASYEAYHDNLDAVRPAAQWVQAAQAAASLSPFDWSELEAGWRLRNLHWGGLEQGPSRSRPVLHSALHLRMAGATLHAAAEAGEERAPSAPEGDMEVLSLESGLRGSWGAGPLRLSPDLRWTFNSERPMRADWSDRQQQAQARLGVGWAHLELSGQGGWGQSERGSQGSLSRRWHAEAGCAWHMGGDPGRRLSLRHRRSQDEAADPADDLSESQSEAGLDLRF